MPVEWPDRRMDVLNGLDILASTPPGLDQHGSDDRWPDVRNAVHWVVDDTWWDQQDPEESIGTLLESVEEAEAVAAVVREIVSVSDHHGAQASDQVWSDDEAWPRVRAAAQHAADVMRRHSEQVGRAMDPECQ